MPYGDEDVQNFETGHPPAESGFKTKASRRHDWDFLKEWYPYVKLLLYIGIFYLASIKIPIEILIFIM
jgi:hypothetical protein